MMVMVIIDTVILGGLTLDPAGMHCSSWDDAIGGGSIYKVGGPDAER